MADNIIDVILAQKGAGDSAKAAMGGFQEGVDAQKAARKEAFRQKLENAGLLSGKEANILAGKEVFDPNRDVTSNLAGTLGNINIADRKSEVDPLDTAKKQAEIKAIQARIEANKRMVDIAEKRAKLAGQKPPKAPTQSQANAALFASRAEQAEKVLNGLFAPIDKGGKGFSVGMGIETSEHYPEYKRPENAKMYRQAVSNFASAVLRKESGATISDSEFKKTENQYFPQPGDTEPVLQQKAENRRLVIEQLKREGQGLGGIAELPQTPEAASNTENAAPDMANMSDADLLRIINE